jgi:hypothetical protein
MSLVGLQFCMEIYIRRKDVCGGIYLRSFGCYSLKCVCMRFYVLVLFCYVVLSEEN